MNLEQEAARVYTALCAGGLAVVPTVAGYGMVALEAGAVERIYALKGRPATKPCVTVTTWPIFDEIAAPMDPFVRRWLAEVTRWSPLAVVTPVDPGSRLLAALHPFVRAQCTRDATVATFHQAGPLVNRVAELAFADGRLLVGSSGNRSGSGNAYRLGEVAAGDSADVVVDVGPIPMIDGTRNATTILDLSSGRFLREGLHFGPLSASWERLEARRREGGQNVSLAPRERAGRRTSSGPDQGLLG